MFGKFLMITPVLLSVVLPGDLAHEYGFDGSTPGFAIRIVDENMDGRALSGPAADDRYPNARIGPPNLGARWLKREGGIEGELAEAHVAPREDKNFVVRFALTPKGRDEFDALTRANIGHWLAVVVDGQIVMAWLNGIEMTQGQGEIDGYDTEEEANALAAAMNATVRR
jgi:preprotein translocase subunit SecD